MAPVSDKLVLLRPRQSMWRGPSLQVVSRVNEQSFLYNSTTERDRAVNDIGYLDQGIFGYVWRSDGS